MKLFIFSSLSVLIVAVLLTACATSQRSPLPTPVMVDLQRFMGTWYVLGYTPLGVDKKAHNAIEHYFLAEDGRIETTYQFRKGAVDGELKTLRPVGRVHNTETNAEWRMQFIWPLKAEYVILDVSDDYQRTIIAHPNRKYAWVMARSPAISGREYEAMLDQLESAGFDRKVILKVPHDWSDEKARQEMIREAGRSNRLVAD